jgi:hypothetical protein
MQENATIAAPLHRPKEGYRYPTIRLPHVFSKLAGLSTQVCQTVYDGALAFFVVISPINKTPESPKSFVFTEQKVTQLGK